LCQYFSLSKTLFTSHSLGKLIGKANIETDFIAPIYIYAEVIKKHVTTLLISLILLLII